MAFYDRFFGKKRSQSTPDNVLARAKQAEKRANHWLETEGNKIQAGYTSAKQAFDRSMAQADKMQAVLSRSIDNVSPVSEAELDAVMGDVYANEARRVAAALPSVPTGPIREKRARAESTSTLKEAPVAKKPKLTSTPATPKKSVKAEPPANVDQVKWLQAKVNGLTNIKQTLAEMSKGTLDFSGLAKRLAKVDKFCGSKHIDALRDLQSQAKSAKSGSRVAKKTVLTKVRRLCLQAASTARNEASAATQAVKQAQSQSQSQFRPRGPGGR